MVVKTEKWRQTVIKYSNGGHHKFVEMCFK